MFETILGGIATLVIAPLAVWYFQNALQKKQALIEERRSDAVVVKRLGHDDHDDAAGVVALYNDLFEDDGTNYSPDELLDFLTQPYSRDRHLPEIENIVLVAKHSQVVVGFIFCHYYPIRRKAIVSYYAIDKRDDKARATAAKILAKELQNILSQPSRTCDFLFFDTQNPDASSDKAENRERRARPALFKLTAESMGLHAYRIDFDYRCPRVSLDAAAIEFPFTLLCIPISTVTLSVPIPRDTIVEFLRFIYEDCYGDFYPVSDSRFEEYRSYLSGLVTSYETTLPALVHAN
jgi:hypothetical protein